MATSTQQKTFRPINVQFLDENRHLKFDLYYKSKGLSGTQYVKFADAQPEHQKKVRDLLRKEDFQEQLFIREDDLLHYYEEITDSLRSFILNPEVPVEKKTRRIYQISKNVMEEFFEYNASVDVLRVSETVAELMDHCLVEEEVGFHSITQILSKDYLTYTHSVNVGLYCMVFGVKDKMRSDDVRELGMGGMLHDVGKVRIARAILNKQGKLTKQEFEEIKKHPDIGVDILKGMNCYGEQVVSMAGQHHERFDGLGYPRGLSGTEITVFSRICKILDVYDALTTRRPYKNKLPPFQALQLMQKEMREHFDVDLFQKFIRYLGPKS